MSRLEKLEEYMRHLSFDENSEQRRVQQEVLDHLHHHDYYLVTVEKGDGGLDRVYSVGLWLSFQHPEIIMVGVPVEIGKLLLSDMKNLIKLGQPPTVSTPLGKCVGSYPVQLEPIGDRKIIREYLLMADWFYGEELFPVLQLFGSDQNGQCSWEQCLEQHDSISQTVF